MTRQTEERHRMQLGLGVSCLLTGSWVFSWVLEISWAGHCSLEASSLDRCSSSVLCACSRALLPIARTMIDRPDAWWPSSDLDWVDFYVSVPRDFVFLSFDSCFHRCAFSVLSRILSLGLWDHDSQIAPQIMGSWLTDCPSDYEIVSHGLSLGLWVHDPQIVPRIVRSYPTDCPSVMRCTVFSDDFCFRELSLRFLGLSFYYYLLALWRSISVFYGICVCLVDV